MLRMQHVTEPAARTLAPSSLHHAHTQERAKAFRPCQTLAAGGMELWCELNMTRAWLVVVVVQHV